MEDTSIILVSKSEVLLDEVRFGWKCFGWENKERRGMVTRGLEWLYFYWGAGTLTWHIPQTIHIGLGEYDNTHVHIAWKNKEIPRVGDERFRMTLHFLVLLRDRHIPQTIHIGLGEYDNTHVQSMTLLCKYREFFVSKFEGSFPTWMGWELDRPESQKGKISNSFPRNESHSQAGLAVSHIGHCENWEQFGSEQIVLLCLLYLFFVEEEQMQMQISWVGDQLVKAATTSNVAKMELKSHFCSGTVLTDGRTGHCYIRPNNGRCCIRQDSTKIEWTDGAYCQGLVKPAGPYLHFALQPILLSGGQSCAGNT